MAIRKYAGDKITGLSSDTKPTNVVDGATFYETNTYKNYVKVSGSWIEITSTTANLAFVTARSAFDQANAAIFGTGGADVTARTTANLALSTAQSAFGVANTGGGGGGGVGVVNVSTDIVNATRFLTFANGTSGTLATANVSTGLTFNPSSNTLTINGPLNAITKSFVINHPSKPNLKLRYGSLEGPENGVYVRGITTSDVIELPDYWMLLIDENTITVNLTGINSKAPSVKHVKDNKVYLNKPLFGDINCYYMVFAERKDVDKLVVEF